MNFAVELFLTAVGMIFFIVMDFKEAISTMIICTKYIAN